MLLSVLIISYNTAELTCQTVLSVLAELERDTQLASLVEIIVVDNNSSDDSVAQLQKLSKKYPKAITLIKNSQNTGFAQANNQAIAQATGQYVLLLNSDTIVQPGALTQLLISFGSHPDQELTSVLASEPRKLDHLGVIAAQLQNPDGTTQSQGGDFPTFWSLLSQMLFLDDLPVVGRLFPSTQHTGRNARIRVGATQLHQQDWVGGTAMMIRKETLENVGLLDENIFMYGEDIEFCMRVKAHHWDIAVDPQAIITHFGSASSSPAKAIMGEFLGYLYIWSKHKPLWQRPVIKKLLQVGCLLRIWVFGTMVKRAAKVQIYKDVWQALLKA